MEANYEPQTLPDLFQDAKLKVYADIEKKENLSKATPSKSTPISKNLPDCIKYILESHPKTDESTFNKLILNIVTGFQKAGYDQQKALEIARPFLEGYAHSTAYTSPNTRTDHFNREWNYTKQNPSYTFDCSYILGLRFSGNAFQCKRCAWNERRPIISAQNRYLNNISSKDILKSLSLNEDGDALLLRRISKDQFCFDHRVGSWFKFNGQNWVRDLRGEIFDKVNDVASLYAEEAQRQLDASFEHSKEGDKEKTEASFGTVKELRQRVKLLRTKFRKQNVIDLSARGAAGLGITGMEWDNDPWSLPCANGVIDLRTGELRPGEPGDYFTIAAPAVYQGIRVVSAIWEDFLNAVFNNDQEIIEFVQTALGASILGRTYERFAGIFDGTGANGKDTLSKALDATLGEFTCEIESATIMAKSGLKDGSSHSADIANLKGRRIVWASETGQDAAWNDEKIKLLTGNGILSAREPYAKRPIQFAPSHNFFLKTNFRPKCNPNDYALWNRIFVVEFPVSFVGEPQESFERKRDPFLEDKLKTETSAILSWLLRGCLRYQEQKHLILPEKVKLAKQAYREENDLLGHWSNERCIFSGREQSGVLYKNYEQWCRDFGHKPWSLTTWGKRMKQRFDATDPKVTRVVYYIGISLNGE